MRKILFSLLLSFSTSSYSEEMNLKMALKAAKTALDSCERKNFNVSVAVVDHNGRLKVFLQSDLAAPHTIDSARAKAYTVASFSQINGLLLLSQMAERILATPASSQLANVPGVIFVGGAAVIMHEGKNVGGIGVGGAPGALLDEACAVDGAKLYSSEAN